MSLVTHCLGGFGGLGGLAVSLAAAALAAASASATTALAASAAFSRLRGADALLDILGGVDGAILPRRGKRPGR